MIICVNHPELNEQGWYGAWFKDVHARSAALIASTMIKINFLNAPEEGFTFEGLPLKIAKGDQWEKLVAFVVCGLAEAHYDA